jgi:hypothetical protein
MESLDTFDLLAWMSGAFASVDARRIRATHPRIGDNACMKRADISSRVVRAGDPPPGPPDWEGSTPESRISAVWELTLQCLAWRGAGEPRLQRSVVRIQRAPR